MATDNEMCSVAEVCEMNAGDKLNPSWISPGFQGVVRSIETKTSRDGKKYYPCTIADSVGSSTIEVSFFNYPKFKEGDLIEISGKGLRRTEFNGKPQAAIGKDTEIHVLGRSVHHEEQKERAVAGQPSVNGQLQPINGQSVGMAIKEALTALVPGNAARLNSTSFWFEIHQFASDVIRISRQLEAGKLAPPVKERNAPKPSETPPPPRTAPRAANQSQPREDNLDLDREMDDVPF